jgi:hypothetical protein
MIKVGSLVKLNPNFYSLTINANPFKDMIGIVIAIEENFYILTYGDRKVNRCKVLFDEIISYEPDAALQLITSEE